MLMSIPFLMWSRALSRFPERAARKKLVDASACNESTKTGKNMAVKTFVQYLKCLWLSCTITHVVSVVSQIFDIRKRPSRVPNSLLWCLTWRYDRWHRKKSHYSSIVIASLLCRKHECQILYSPVLPTLPTWQVFSTFYHKLCFCLSNRSQIL